MSTVSLIRLAVRVRPEHAEMALAELLELAPSGVEEVERDDVIEYAIYGPPGEVPELPEVRAAVGDALVDVVAEETSYDNERWREFHRPVEAVGAHGTLRVRAPWHDACDGDLVIDPGQAFGTGAHPTTRLCLELMLEDGAGDDAGTVVDLGCGSGVLAIAAARLGWGDGGVLGLDDDVLAVAATRDNAVVNGVTVEARVFDLHDEQVPAADVVLANLLRPLLLAARFTAPPRLLVASGLLAREADEVSEHLAGTLGLVEARRLESDGWAALALERAA